MGGGKDWRNYSKNEFIHLFDGKKIRKHYSLIPLYGIYALGLALPAYFTLRSCIINPDTHFSPALYKKSLSNDEWGFRRMVYWTDRDFSTYAKPSNFVDYEGKFKQ